MKKNNRKPQQKKQEVVVEEKVVVEEQEKPKKYYQTEEVKMIDETNFLIGERAYRLVVDHREAFNLEALGERYSEILNRYDYIVGDWGYEQLRLKGFFKDSHKKTAPELKISTLEDYLYEFCNFGCAYFVVEKVTVSHEKPKKNPHNRKKNQQEAHIAERKFNVKEQQNKPKKLVRKENPQKENLQKEVDSSRHFKIRQKEQNE